MLTTQVPLMSTDPFIYLKYMTHTILERKFVRLYLRFFSVHCLLSMTIESFYLVYNWEWKMFLRYSPAIFLELYAFLSLTTIVIYVPHHRKHLERMRLNSWSPQFFDNSIEKARKDLLLALVIICVVLFSGTVSFFSYAQTFANLQKTVSLIPRIYSAIYGDQAIFFMYLYWFSIPIMFYCTVSLPIGFLYFVLHIKVQIQLLNEFLRQATAEPFSNKNIKTVLIFCIRRHIFLLNFPKEMVKDTRFALLVVSASGFAGIVSCGLLIMTSINENDLSLFLCGSNIACTGLFITILFAICGQGLIDQTENTFMQATSCPWYMWNMENRKILLMFLTCSMRPISFKVQGFLEVSHVFLRKHMQQAYSYAMIMYNLMHTHEP